MINRRDRKEPAHFERLGAQEVNSRAELEEARTDTGACRFVRLQQQQ
jgi:hypothetical protein